MFIGQATGLGFVYSKCPLIGYNIEQAANTYYNLNACNKALIKISKAKLEQLRLA
jgi:hypothetical protein